MPENQAAIAIIIFLITYVVIIAEKMHRTVIAMLGAVVMILMGIIGQEAAVRVIDFNTLGLLIGMMIIVGIIRPTGVFEYLAVKAAKLARGEPLNLLVLLAMITAVLSAFLDNVTTVLLIVPVTFSLTRTLGISPLPFLMAEVFSANIGGTATLIGDPPNIMIGSAVGLTFNDFVLNLAPVIIVVESATLIALRWLYRQGLRANPAVKGEIMALDELSAIKDPVLLRKSLLVLALTILGFVLHGQLELASATVALTGAFVLLAITREEPAKALTAVEWPTLFFFTGLFIVVGGLEQAGVIRWVAQASISLTGGNMATTTFLILWLSAVASAFVDNIPFVATMIPLIKTLGQIGNLDLMPLWWSLSLGACLGGNGTIIGASANVIVAGLAEKNGLVITFKEFMKVAFPLMLLSVAICHLYLWWRYF